MGDPLTLFISCWAQALRERAGWQTAAVALANKNVRDTSWCPLKSAPPGWAGKIRNQEPGRRLYLLQVADHSQIDIAQAAKSKLARNALKYPATRAIARVSPARASVPGTHVLLDYENVQPTEGELRAMVPDASQVWVFHGPHQGQVEQRFGSFGADVTAVPT